MKLAENECGGEANIIIRESNEKMWRNKGRNKSSKDIKRNKNNKAKGGKQRDKDLDKKGGPTTGNDIKREKRKI